MKKDEYATIAVADLSLGLTVDLDVGWLKHPFPKNRFRITTPSQIETLRSLGLQRVRYLPALSDPAPAQAAPPSADVAAHMPKAPGLPPSAPSDADPAPLADAKSPPLSPRDCEQRFSQAAAAYSEACASAASLPQQAGALSRSAVDALVADMLDNADTAIRLLQNAPQDPQAMHPVNVAVMSLLLGRALGMQQNALQALGLAAFLHDIGSHTPAPSPGAQTQASGAVSLQGPEDHIARGVELARSMGMDAEVLSTMAQHHAMCDGSGYPAGLDASALGQAPRILALVNEYDNLCNPLRPGAASTPHEALAVMFSRMKSRFDGVALTTFIRLMGVYPPGSLVQLQDDRYAMVVGVNAARPLKPRVMVHEAGVPRSQARELDLQHTPGLGILRSLRPSLVPDSTLEYFAPPRNACFYFEARPQPSRPFQSM